jgi:hypothetical protein
MNVYRNGMKNIDLKDKSKKIKQKNQSKNKSKN